MESWYWCSNLRRKCPRSCSTFQETNKSNSADCLRSTSVVYHSIEIIIHNQIDCWFYNARHEWKHLSWIYDMSNEQNTTFQPVSELAIRKEQNSFSWRSTVISQAKKTSSLLSNQTVLTCVTAFNIQFHFICVYCFTYTGFHDWHIIIAKNYEIIILYQEHWDTNICYKLMKLCSLRQKKDVIYITRRPVEMRHCWLWLLRERRELS